ncbi:MAG TPA: hypothetical protein VFY22_05135 [Hydrogenophaga sp.]|nr:hypothetical protein [Hydrogenophaga sp.]
MASDLDTVRVLRALFNDMPRAPEGLSQEETVAWLRQSMLDYEGGDMAYMLEHVTRNAMLDIALRLREDGNLQDDAAFDETLEMLSNPEGRKTFMNCIIAAQKTVDTTARLLRRAKRTVGEPEPHFSSLPEEIQRFVEAVPSGPGPLYAEYAQREDVIEIGVFAAVPAQVHEFSWGFVTEHEQAWHFYVADVWRRGTVGYFDRFDRVWQRETTAPRGGPLLASPVPPGIAMDDGISSFCSMVLTSEAGLADLDLRLWVGEVFVQQVLPYMVSQVLDEDDELPLP